MTFNATKMKLLSFNHLLVYMEINGIDLREETCFRLLALTFTRSMDWKPYTVHCQGCFKEIRLPLYGPAFPYSLIHLVSVQIYHLTMYGILFPYLGLNAEMGSQLSRIWTFCWFASPSY